MCPAGVKVCTLPGKPEVSGLIPESGVLHLPRVDLRLDCVKRMYT